MREARSGFTSVAAGILVALTGLLPMMWLIADRQPEPPTLDPTVAVAAPASPATTRVVEVTATEPPLAVADLPPEIVRVLQANGYATRLTPDDPAAALPPRVLRVLIDHGVVLTVADTTSRLGG